MELIFPAGQTGVVWEAADLNGGRVTPSQRVYTSLEGKNWWTGSKWELNLEECPALVDLMNNLSDSGWGIYEGDWGNAAWLIYTSGISYEDQPENVELVENCKNMYGEDFALTSKTYTKEQLEYLVYSITGNKTEIQDLNAWVTNGDFMVRICGNGVIMYWGAGSISGYFLKNMVSEYAGNGKWKVTADCMYGCDGEPTIQSSVMTFTVIRNPDSCFDGYSVTGVEVTPTDNSEWAKAYYDYILNVKSEEDILFPFRAFLCNIDDDGIPEIIWDSGTGAGGTGFWHYSNGSVIEEWVGNYGGISYIPGSGLVRGSGGNQGSYYDSVYRFENGQIQEIGSGSYEEHYDDEWGYDWNGEYDYKWNGEAVSGEEYEARINEVFSQPDSYSYAISFENSYSQDLDSILRELQSYMNN